MATKTVTIREVLHKTATGTDSPEGVSVEVDFVAQPPEIDRYLLRVDIEATARETGLSVEAVQTNIETAHTATTLLPFSYMNIGTKYERSDVFDAESSTEAYEGRYGTVDLILEEVL